MIQLTTVKGSNQTRFRSFMNLVMHSSYKHCPFAESTKKADEITVIGQLAIGKSRYWPKPNTRQSLNIRYRPNFRMLLPTETETIF